MIHLPEALLPRLRSACYPLPALAQPLAALFRMIRQLYLALRPLAQERYETRPQLTHLAPRLFAAVSDLVHQAGPRRWECNKSLTDRS